MEMRAEVAALAGRVDDLGSARRELDRLLRRRIGYDIAAISTVDPATMLWTSCYVSGLDAEGSQERERLLFDLEFRGGDLNGYTEIATRPVPVASLARATGGDLSRAARWAPLLSPLGVVDEMRAVLRVDNQCWGTLTLYRTGRKPVFSDPDLDLVADAAPAVARLIRLMLLRAALAQPAAVEQPPGTLTVAPDGSVVAMSEIARQWLDQLDDRGRLPSVVQSVAAATRRGDGLAHGALPNRSGGFVVLHGSRMTGTDDVSIIIEGARTAVLSEVIAQAHGFTPREREVTALAALGRTTRQMARELGISPFTVADHLKAAFAKVGVASRGELVAALYQQHYLPRAEGGLPPGPYGWYLDENVV